MDIHFFYKKEILKHLNKIGYKHFISEEKCNIDDYQEGIGFFCNVTNKKYGACFITSTTMVKEKKYLLNLN